MPSEQPASTSPPEFRRYRRFLSWLVLGFVSLGSVYMLVSVGVSIYRRRNAVPAGAPADGPVLITDRYRAYDHLPPERRSLCWAHLARDFRAKGLEVHLLETPLITHAEVDRRSTAMDVWRLVRFWTELLEE